MVAPLRRVQHLSIRAGTWKNANIDLLNLTLLTLVHSSLKLEMVQSILTTFISMELEVGNVIEAGSPASSAPTPTKDASEVISVYSNAYTDVSVSTFDAAWDANVFDGNFAIGSDNVLKYSALATAGIELPQPSSLDISGKTHVHFDVWTPDNTNINLKLVDYKSDGNWGADNVEHEYTVSNVSQNQWTSVDIALSDFTGLTSKENIGQIIFSTGTEQNRTMATVFIDNIYFYGTADTSNDSSGDHLRALIVKRLSLTLELQLKLPLPLNYQFQNKTLIMLRLQLSLLIMTL